MPSHPVSTQQQEVIDRLSIRGYGTKAVSGPAGSGKTTIIRAIADDDTVVVAPTNAAVRVLRSKGLRAATIHKTFYTPEEYENSAGRICTRFVANDKWLREDSRRVLTEGKLSHAGRVIVDEASMVHSKVIKDLERMCQEVILVGDGNQLPPVADRQYPRGLFNTLTPFAELTEVHRQADGNPALAIATRLRSGALHPLHADVVRGFQPTVNLSAQLAALKMSGGSWRIVTYTNAERHGKNARVRAFLGFAGEITPQPGELLISLENYDDAIVNGTFLRVVSAAFPDLSDGKATLDKLYGRVTVTVEDAARPEPINLRVSMAAWLHGFKELAPMRSALAALEDADPNKTSERSIKLNFGYAITCHKAQGSEFDHVFVVDQRGVVGAVARKEAEMAPEGIEVLSSEEAARRWTYTAFTRTRGGLTVIRTEPKQ